MSTPSRRPKRRPAEQERAELLDEMARVLEGAGFPHGIARVYAALTLVEGEGASTSDLTQTLDISKASITTAMQFLIGTKLVERYRVRGSREAHYRNVKGSWEEILSAKFAATSHIRKVTERALEVAESEQARERIQEMHDVYAFFEKEMAEMMRRWNRRNRG
ncbi:MAG: GbsR/MarR family transcriptional regulator [Myxococcota bacterium]